MFICQNLKKQLLWHILTINNNNSTTMQIFGRYLSISKYFCTLKIPIAALKKLREETSAPMGQCKKALQQTNCNHQEALKWLQQKGLLSAEKMINKETREGVIACNLSPCRTKAVLVEVNCETDFVAKNELFLNFVSSLQNRFLQSEEYLDCQEASQQTTKKVDDFLHRNSPMNLFPDQNNQNMHEEMKLVIARLQQNIRIRRVVTLHSDGGRFGSYVHRGYTSDIGLQASIVQLFESQVPEQNQTEQHEEILNEFADNIATQILGSPPKYYYAQQIPEEILEQQTAKVRAQMAQALQKAPEHTHDKIISGKLNSNFYANCFLYSMNYILSNEGQTVGQYWEQMERQLDTQVNIGRVLKWQCK